MKKTEKHADRSTNGSFGGMEKARLAALADGIFSVAMTLLVLDIKLPENLRMAGNDELMRQLSGLGDRFAVYAFSFAILGIYWVGHHFQFHFLHRTDRLLLWINLAFLFFITLVPFSTSLLGSHPDAQVAVVAYGANLVLIALMMCFHMEYMIRHPGLATRLTPLQATHARWRLLFYVVVPLGAIALSFFSLRASFWIFTLMAPAFVLPSKIDADL